MRVVTFNLIFDWFLILSGAARIILIFRIATIMTDSKKTQLIAVNRECDRKNQFFIITDWTEEQIQNKIDEFDKNKWLMILR